MHSSPIALPVRLVALLFAAVVAFVVQPAAARADDVTVRVDERVELLTIVARLAGADEFLMANSASPYADRVAKHFAPFASHRAIDAYRAIRRDHGASYDAIASLALHLDAVPTLAERIPFDRHPPRLDARWELTATRAFLVELRAFAAESKASEFFAREKEFYAACEARIAPVLSEAKAVAWFDGFFGAKQGASYIAIPGLLCGGGNYGVGVRFLDETPEEIRPVLGCYRWDADGLPRFDEGSIGTFVHELCHSYTNPIVDRHLDALRDGGSRIFPLVARRMTRMAYSSWEILVYESFVRASVIRYLKDVRGPAAAAAEAAEQEKVGFTWVPALAERFGTYAAARDRYPTLDAFLPEIATFLSREADRMVAEAAKRGERTPKLTSIQPANGDTNVEPSVTTLVLQFDRPMQRKSWSFVGAKEVVPEIVGTPTWDTAGKVLTATVRLVPGRTYRFSLNSERFTGFRAEDGTPLEPTDVTFTVKAF